LNGKNRRCSSTIVCDGNGKENIYSNNFHGQIRPCFSFPIERDKLTCEEIEKTNAALNVLILSKHLSSPAAIARYRAAKKAHEKT